MIIFYDIPSAPPLRFWSPNTWKTRLTLNYKGIPYKTEWIEYPDIKAVYTKYGIPPMATYPDGTGYYSLPLIYDESTGKAIHDSIKIAKYLDETYPNTPRVTPIDDEGTERLNTFYKEFGFGALMPLYPTLFKAALPILNPPSQAHYTVARAKDLAHLYGEKASLDEISLSDEEKKKAWSEFKTELGKLGEKYFGGKERKAWLFQESPGFGDFTVAGALLFIQAVYGEGSDEWKSMIAWDEGKWGNLIERLSSYITTP